MSVEHQAAYQLAAFVGTFAGHLTARVNDTLFWPLIAVMIGCGYLRFPPWSVLVAAMIAAYVDLWPLEPRWVLTGDIRNYESHKAWILAACLIVAAAAYGLGLLAARRSKRAA